MEKEEKKADLEQLLNSLIERGWLPRGEDKIHSCRYYGEEKKFKADYTIAGIPQVLYRSLTELCSKSSGLWQFVCENNLNYSEDDSIYNVWLKHYAEDDHESPYTYASPVWYLIESALKDESELEDFLLSNIKVEGNEK